MHLLVSHRGIRKVMQSTTDHLTKSFWFIASAQPDILKYVQVTLTFCPLLLDTFICGIIPSQLIVTQNKNGETNPKGSYIELTIESIPHFVLGFSLKLMQKPSLSCFMSQCIPSAFFVGKVPVLIPDHEEPFFCPLQI